MVQEYLNTLTAKCNKHHFLAMASYLLFEHQVVYNKMLHLKTSTYPYFSHFKLPCFWQTMTLDARTLIAQVDRKPNTLLFFYVRELKQRPL